MFTMSMEPGPTGASLGLVTGDWVIHHTHRASVVEGCLPLRATLGLGGFVQGSYVGVYSYNQPFGTSLRND